MRLWPRFSLNQRPRQRPRRRSRARRRSRRSSSWSCRRRRTPGLSWIRSFFWRRFGSLLSYASYCLSSVIQLNMTSTSSELASSPAPVVVYLLELDCMFRRLLCVCLQFAIPHSNSSLEFHFASIYLISVCNQHFYQVCAFCVLEFAISE